MPILIAILSWFGAISLLMIISYLIMRLFEKYISKSEKNNDQRE